MARVLARGLAALALLLAVLLGALWLWAGSPGSLATTLRLAQRFLPADQRLEVQDASGTLRGGGQIALLRWSDPQLTVQVRDARLAWSSSALLRGQLRLSELHARRITLSPLDTPGSEPPPTGPPQNLALPLAGAHLPLSADEIVWAAPGAAPLAISDLRGEYEWDGGTHHLRIDSVALARGRYQARASLTGAAPMRLAASVRGQVQADVPESGMPIDARVQTDVEGTLAGADARLAINAQLTGEPSPPAGGAARAQAPAPISAELTAQVAPWAAQPLAQAHARLRALDLAALWPGAPVTRLSGTATLQPKELPAPAGWALEADLTNETPGPWNEHRLPLSALQARASYSGGDWQVPEARIDIGPGVLTVSNADYDSATQALRARFTLRDLSPARVYAGLAATPVSGSAEVSGSMARGLRVRARLTGAPSSRRDELALEHMQLDGEWKAGTARIDRLSLAALQANVEARDFTITPAERAAGGELSARAPGATLQLKGRLAPRGGEGRIDLAVQDAATLQRWLAALPWPVLLPPKVPAPALLQTQATGSAHLQAHWQGGWQTALQAMEGSASAPASTPPLKLQARLAVPGLTLQTPGGAPLALNDVRASVDGTLAQLSLSLDGGIRHGAGEALLSASTQLRASAALQKPGSWQAQVSKLTLAAQTGARPGPWRVRLTAPLTLALHGGARPQWQTGAWQAEINGPEPGSATLHVEPLTLAWPGARPHLVTQGRIDGVPLAWANALEGGQPTLLARLGVSGDVMLGARWRIDLAEQLQAQVDIERTRGELRLRIDGQDTPAGVREAALRLRADGGQLELNAIWHSTHAGEATLTAHVPLVQAQAQGSGGWALAAAAPLSGTLHAALPDVGVWSSLAPPGWRVRGSLAADATLSGEPRAPRLAGQISADGLALRSVLDGVDLQEGRLRARLDGERLEITELTLHGGGGSGARILGPGGNLTPAPKDGGTLSASGAIAWQGQQVHLDIQAQARALQVLSRADRQLSVSGLLRARLQDGQAQLTGELTADRASLLLPDDSAPTLGADVVVHDRAQADTTPAAEPQKPQARPAQAPRVDVKLDLGDDFAVQGHGLTTRLKGQVHIVSDGSGNAGAMPRVLGEIRTEQGRYRAWGQVLDVETGLLRFSGAMDNPQLDILALRPRISERVGVQVSGSAQAPRVRLYSEPDMPDAEKLSWLVLGRSAAAGGADAALMQQAALALLGGGRDPGSTVARHLGLDEIGFRGADASNPASGAALTLGKRLSRDLYVSYEHSLAGAMGTLYIFLDLSSRLTLRGQTGAQSGLDLIYTLRYD